MSHSTRDINALLEKQRLLAFGKANDYEVKFFPIAPQDSLFKNEFTWLSSVPSDKPTFALYTNTQGEVQRLVLIAPVSATRNEAFIVPKTAWQPLIELQLNPTSDQTLLKRALHPHIPSMIRAANRHKIQCDDAYAVDKACGRIFNQSDGAIRFFASLLADVSKLENRAEFEKQYTKIIDKHIANPEDFSVEDAIFCILGRYRDEFFFRNEHKIWILKPEGKSFLDAILGPQAYEFLVAQVKTPQMSAIKPEEELNRLLFDGFKHIVAARFVEDTNALVPRIEFEDPNNPTSEELEKDASAQRTKIKLQQGFTYTTMIKVDKNYSFAYAKLNWLLLREHLESAITKCEAKGNEYDEVDPHDVIDDTLTHRADFKKKALTKAKAQFEVILDSLPKNLNSVSWDNVVEINLAVKKSKDVAKTLVSELDKAKQARPLSSKVASGFRDVFKSKSPPSVPSHKKESHHMARELKQAFDEVDHPSLK